MYHLVIRYRRMENNRLAELVAKMRKDPEFFEAVSNMADLTVDDFNNIVRLYTLYHCYKSAFFTSSIRVGYYGVKFSITHRGLIYAKARTYILGKKQPFVGMLFCAPRFVIAQMMFIRTLYLIAVYMA